MSEDLNMFLEPGAFVRHPKYPDWGVGQVQSNVHGKITINFEHQGKCVIDSHYVALIPVQIT